MVTPASSGKAQSSSSITTPFRASRAAGISSSWSTTGWSWPSINPPASSEQQAVSDLAGGPGDGDPHRCAGAGRYPCPRVSPSPFGSPPDVVPPPWRFRASR